MSVEKNSDYSETHAGIQTCLIIALSALEALNILMMAGLCFQARPLHSPLEGQIMPEWLAQFKPTRDIFFYRFFLVTVFGIFGLLAMMFRRKIGTISLTRPLARFVVFELLIAGLALFSLFQNFAYGDIHLAGKILYCWGAAFILTKIFWRQIDLALARAAGAMADVKKTAVINRWVGLSVPFLIFLLIFVPDISGLAAHIFCDDLYYHFDGVVMSSAWAVYKGGIPDVDMANSYGIGLPFVLSGLARIFGGVNYEHVLFVLIILSIVYFTACFFLLSYWLNNVLLALAGVILMIKLQMFHYGAAPIIWKYPNGTVVRYFFDIFFLWALFGFGRQKKIILLMLAGFMSGFSIFYVSDNGIYQAVTYYFFVLTNLIIPEHRKYICSGKNKVWKLLGIFLLPVLTAGISLRSFVGVHLFEIAFWQNVSEQMSLFLQGFCSVPVSWDIQNGYVFPFLFGCVILLGYLAAVFIPAGRWLRGQKVQADEIFVASLGIYGLFLFHYYICQATSARYFCTCVPYILLFCCAAQHILRSKFVKHQQWISILLVIVTFLSLLTTRLFIQYPNILTWRQDTFAEDRLKMAQNVPAKADIRLIEKLTRPDQKVCLLSSNETLILMQADRQPFFYFFPMVNSRSASGLDFGGLYLFTQKRVEKTIHQLQNESPQYVFIEKKIYQGKLPMVYYKKFKSLVVLLEFLNANYIPEQEGANLVALRKLES